ncbi:MAG: hypothetical protein QOH24_2250 [Verrucomicrobiota bacterium]
MPQYPFLRTADLARLSLINVRGRKFESVAQQLDPRLRFFSHDNLYDVESEQNVGIVEQLQPGQRAAGNEPLFRQVHRFERPAEIFARPRFDFDEDKRVVIPTDHIHFAAAARPEIAVQNFVAVVPQKFAGEFFAASSYLQVVR